MMRLFLIGFVAILVAGCDKGDLGPGAGALTNVQVSFSTQRGAAPMQMSAERFGDTTVVGADTLVLTSAEIVLRQIELKRVDVVTCDTLATTDDCEEFEAGPFLVDLPTDSGATPTFALDIPSGMYDEIEFEIHKAGDDNAADSAFVAAHPDFDKLSIRVRGSFNGQTFEFTSDLNVEQELNLIPALTITDGSQPTNLTILVELATWFRDTTGALIDPATGNKGGANESVVTENIKQAFEAFEDDDGDGSPSS